MIQLWVNLPAEAKMSAPRYQELLKKQIPVIDLSGGAGILRVIAGEAFGETGPAQTVTPMNLWDLTLSAGGETTLTLPENTNTLVLGLEGAIRLNERERLVQGELARLTGEGETLSLSAAEPARALVLNGAPIEEPVVAHGPFVMNTSDEIREALLDYQAGKMGHLV